LAWQTAFGQNFDRAKAERLRQQWVNRDFRQLPKVQTLGSQVLGAANGAYAASTNTIYLSETFLKTAPTASIVNAILEEIGHYVDATINASDSAGDEGAIFAALVQGEQLSSAQLRLLKAENDWTTLQINGKSVVVEQAILTGTTGNDTLVGTAVDDVISGLAGNETVVLTLASGAGYAIGTTNPVTGTIQNDDFPVLSINDVTVVEGKDASALLTLSVDTPSPQPISVNFATSPVDATANGDYTTRTGTLIFQRTPPQGPSRFRSSMTTSTRPTNPSWSPFPPPSMPPSRRMGGLRKSPSQTPGTLPSHAFCRPGWKTSGSLV
jgi:hypothetical protein